MPAALFHLLRSSLSLVDSRMVSWWMIYSQLRVQLDSHVSKPPGARQGDPGIAASPTSLDNSTLPLVSIRGIPPRGRHSHGGEEESEGAHLSRVVGCSLLPQKTKLNRATAVVRRQAQDATWATVDLPVDTYSVGVSQLAGFGLAVPGGS